MGVGVEHGNKKELRTTSPVGGGEASASFSDEIIAAAHLPTSARPGSPEKIEILAARYASGVQLWNEGDAKGFADTSLGLDYEQEGFDDDDWESLQPGRLTSRSTPKHETPASETRVVAPNAPACGDSEGNNTEVIKRDRRARKTRRSTSYRPRKQTHDGDSCTAPGEPAESQAAPQVAANDSDELLTTYKSLLLAAKSGGIAQTDVEKFERGHPDVVQRAKELDDLNAQAEMETAEV